MSVRVRLTRVGSKKNAQWRVVVADQRSPRDGRCIEMIGHYNPQTEPSRIVIDEQRLQHWLERGAQPSNTVKKLMRAQAAGGGAAVAVAEEQAAEDAAEPSPEGESPAQADAEAEAPEAPAEAADETTSEGDPGSG